MAATPLPEAVGSPYEGLRVVELGSRIAASACGRMLADLGATVFVPESDAAVIGGGKWRDRANAVAGKYSVRCDASTLRALITQCDVVVTCSDHDVGLVGATELAEAIDACPVVCDITAFGHSGPWAGRPASEVEIQAASGLLETTGRADGAALPIGVPIVEMSAGLYAADAIAVALHALRRYGTGDRIDIALFDVAFNALTTFVPAHFAGRTPKRLGNGHGMAVPWNAYPAADGWVLICSANDPQWQRLARLIGPALPAHPEYDTLVKRVAARGEVDALVAAWTRLLPSARIVEMLADANVASGAIVPLRAIDEEPNLVLRQTVGRVVDPQTGATVRVPNALVRLQSAMSTGNVPSAVAVVPRIPAVDEGRALADAAITAPRRPPVVPRAGDMARPPLEGLRVVEIGQFTAAPLAARHLSSFGAEVLKIEPEGGEGARDWAPLRGGTSHFFVMSNGEKRSVALDLRTPAGHAALAELLRTADVLVENLKPGSLDALGFDGATLQALNPRLVHCAISGFGARSVYGGRPAFDTVIQAMSGMMDATRDGDVPLKSGISAADIMGGQVAFFAILAALAARDRSGVGSAIDLSMQDIGAWSTQTLWNVPQASVCYDGVVNAVADACESPQAAARALIVRRVDADGIEWELFGSPMRLEHASPRIGTPIGKPVPGGAVGWSGA